MRLVLVGRARFGQGHAGGAAEGAPAGAAHLHRRPAARRSRRRQQARPGGQGGDGARRPGLRRDPAGHARGPLLAPRHRATASSSTATRATWPRPTRWTRCWRASASRWTARCSWTCRPNCWSSASPAAPRPKAAPTTVPNPCASACRSTTSQTAPVIELLPPARQADRGRRRGLAGRGVHPHPRGDRAGARSRLSRSCSPCGSAVVVAGLAGLGNLDAANEPIFAPSVHCGRARRYTARRPSPQ